MRVSTLYGTKEVVTEQRGQMELRYYLVQEIRSDERWNGRTGNMAPDVITYGIRIVKIEGEQKEQEYLSGLSASMDSVERLLRQMMYGLVTPMTAAAVADDWLGDMAG